MVGGRSWRRRLLRIGIGAVVVGAVAVLALLCLPVPIGWAVNLAARRALPPALGLQAGVASGTLRWRLGRDTAEIDLAGIKAQVKDRPLAEVAHVVIEVDKAAVWRGYYAPRVITVTAPRLLVDGTAKGAFTALEAANIGSEASPPSPVPPSSLMTLAPALPAPGRKAHVHIEELRVDYIFPGARWGVAGRIDATLAREGDDVHADFSVNLGTATHPIGGTLTADASLRTGRVAATIALPEFRTADLPPLPSGRLPLEGVVAFKAGAEADFATRTLRSAKFDLSLRDGTLALPAVAGPPLAIERVTARGQAETRDGMLTARMDEAEVVVEGAHVNLRQLDAMIGPRPRVSWDAEITQLEGRRLAPRLPGIVRAMAPWVPQTLEVSALDRLASNGAATLGRDSSGTLVVRDLDTAGQLRVKVADASITVDMEARERDGGTLEATVHLAPFEPAKLASAFPTGWLIASAAFPFGGDVRAHASPGGELLDASVRVDIGAGEIRSSAGLPLTVPIRRIGIEARLADKGARVDIPTLVAETALGRVELAGVAIAHDTRAATAGGHLIISDVAFGAFEKIVPAAVLASLHDAGLGLGDFALHRCTAEFNTALHARPTGEWYPADAKGVADITAGYAGKPVAMRAAVSLPAGGSEAHATLTVGEFSPADFGPRRVAGVQLSDFRFPIQVTADAALSAADMKLKSASLQVRAGPGEAYVAAVGASLPFVGANAAASYDPMKNEARVEYARLQLAPGIEAGVERVAVALPPAPLRITGVARIMPLDVTRMVAWWPDKLLPNVRAEVVAAAPAGKLSTDGIKFELDSRGEPGGALALHRVQGECLLASASAQPPGVAGAVGLDEARITVDYPHAGVRMKGAHVTGVTIADLHASVDDIRVPRPVVTADTTFLVDLAAIKPWFDVLPSVPSLALFREATGTVHGQLSATGKPDASDPSGAKSMLILKAERVAVPGIFDGPLDFALNLAAPNASTFALDGRIAVGEARVLAVERRSEVGPLTWSATVANWRAGEKPSVALSLENANVAGLPLQCAAAVDLAEGWTTMIAAKVTKFTLGRTQFSAELRSAGPGHQVAVVHAAQLDVGQLVATVAPWLNMAAKPAAPAVPPRAKTILTKTTVLNAAAKPPDPNAMLAVMPVPVAPPERAVRLQPTARPASSPRFELKFDAAEINFGPDRRLQNVTAEVDLRGDWPQTARLSAMEGERNSIRIELLPAKGNQHLMVAIADTAALARALTEPLRIAALSPGTLPDSLATAGQIPNLIAGGALEVDGEVSHAGGDLRAHGTFVLTDATMIRPPRVLQLLALKSGKSLERTPLIRKLSVGEWSVEPEQAMVKAVALDGTGLMDRVKLNSACYAFADQKLAIDGEYFGVGFEVIGTRADPQVFLKENAAIHAIGQRNEFDVFFDDPTPSKKK